MQLCSAHALAWLFSPWSVPCLIVQPMVRPLAWLFSPWSIPWPDCSAHGPSPGPIVQPMVRPLAWLFSPWSPGLIQISIFRRFTTFIKTQNMTRSSLEFLNETPDFTFPVNFIEFCGKLILEVTILNLCPDYWIEWIWLLNRMESPICKVEYGMYIIHWNGWWTLVYSSTFARFPSNFEHAPRKPVSGPLHR
jgi:hypothetical protein